MITTAISTSSQSDDPLSYLPHKGMVEYRRRQLIYDEQRPSSGLSLVVSGRVKVATVEDGTETVTGIYRAEEFFGTGAILGGNVPQRERATALEKTTLMTWSRAEVEAQIERHPRLGLALMQVLVARCLDLKERLQSLALDKMTERFVRTQIRFAMIGARDPDGGVSLPPLTHDVLSGYLCASRGMVTVQMNSLRRDGLVQYSRQAIRVYPEALTEHLRQQA
jgi:CRP/FNR family cyclic AMP-dependent transcriptional regulator